MTTKTKRELLGLIAMIVGGGGMYFLTKYIVFSVLMYLFTAMGGHGTLLALDLETAAEMAALLVFIFGGHKLFKVIAYGKDKPKKRSKR